MSALSLRARITAGLALAATSAVVALVATAPAAGAATCSDVDVSFARGTGEAAGLGSVGKPFVSSLTSDLSGRTVSSYAVDYAANTAQTSAGPGSTDLANHVTSLAASCPNTQFVLGGYSQGATVVDLALGIRAGTTSGTAISTSLAPRIKAVVVYGNPLGLQGQTIATASTLYGPKSRDYCNTGDPVCGGGSNTAAHLQYATNGTTTTGAAFAAGLITTSPTAPAPTTPAPTTPAPTTPAPTTPAPTAPSATCVTSSTSDHVAAGRATTVFGYDYARGSNNFIGLNSRFVTVSLKSTATGYWSLVRSC